YGDVFPLTALGKLIASLAMLLGVVLLALPISVLSSNIVTRWLDMKKQHARGSSPPPPHLLLYEGLLGRHSASGLQGPV
ncbi:voltage-gated ion channel superfamily, partial [Haematococcus lacustris]